MFEKEEQICTNLYLIAQELIREAGFTEDDVVELRFSLEQLAYDGTPTNDELIDEMCRQERKAAQSLTQFDATLNRLIRERIKLGDFELKL